MKAWIVGSLDADRHVAYLQCFVEKSNNGDEDSETDGSAKTTATAPSLKDLCCDAIDRCPIHVLDRTTVRHQVCPRHLTSLRSETNAALIPIPLRQKVPTYALLESSPTTPIERETTQYEGGQSSTSSSSWSHFLWDDRRRQGTALGTDAAEVENFMRVDDLIVRTTPSNDGDGGIFRASIQNEISETGGMHRTLQHRIGVDLPEKDEDVLTWSVDLYLLVHLPADLFLNPEDAFLSLADDNEDGAKWNVTLMDENLVIDQENPVFDSTAHIVYVRVQGSGIRRGNSNNNGDRDGVVFRFGTKLHVRYPEPQPDGIRYTRIVMMSPTLVAGRLEGMKKNGNVADRRYQLAPQLRGLRFDPPLVIPQVPVGSREDLPLVLGITVTATLVGTFLILRVLGNVQC